MDEATHNLSLGGWESRWGSWGATRLAGVVESQPKRVSSDEGVEQRAHEPVDRER